jgi:hypothetical protein
MHGSYIHVTELNCRENWFLYMSPDMGMKLLRDVL